MFGKQGSLGRIYAFSFLATAIIFLVVGYAGGLTGFLTVLVLAALEITFSFDNAVVNAKVLERMSSLWRTAFMTVGIIIAVVGVRFLLPIILVSLTAGISMGDVLKLAFDQPDQYARYLTVAHPAIASFGGIFLLLIFVEFIVDYGRKVQWLESFETPLMKIGRLRQFPLLTVLAVLLLVTMTLGGDHKFDVLVAGIVALIVYLAIRGISELFEMKEKRRLSLSEKSGVLIQTGFISFLYLELLDASFSLDSVLGSFAITNKVLLIAAGLGVGAVWVRSMTIHIVRHHTLVKYRYLEHGAHYAVGALSVILLLGIRYDVQEAVTGSVGIVIITLALFDSWRYNKKHEPSPAVKRTR